MPISNAQLIANRLNAHKSKGPITLEGKAKVSNNAFKHGLFSRHLVLPDEDPVEYQALLDNLIQDLSPQGALESALVERIAVALWRQRRLVKAENANIQLETYIGTMANEVRQYLGLDQVSEAMIIPPDCERTNHYQWCELILQEMASIDLDNLDMNNIAETAPAVFEQIRQEAEHFDQSVDGYLSTFDQKDHYFRRLASYSRNRIREHTRHQLVSEIAVLIKATKLAIRGQASETLAKYQVLLDNELYKAMRALREAREWRSMPDGIVF